jgi:hypothetical protein
MLTGTPNQIEMANLILPTVNGEFDRVANAFHALALTQSPEARANTLIALTVLEEKRTEVLSNPSAGYFIAEWRELSDQVRKLIAKDPRHIALQTARKNRNPTHAV